MENPQAGLRQLNLSDPRMPDTWAILFERAMMLIDEIDRHGKKNPFWTFGGGTALMLRYVHRFSKDIDIFVPDPQSLGYVTPRLSSVAESLTTEYQEAAVYVKLYFPEGEIDFVASPNLTSPGYETHEILGRQVNLETPEEVIAKKMWHRGHAITGRDIFDFALVSEKEPASLARHAQFMTRHADAIFQQLEERYEPLKVQFEAVDALAFHPDFDEACARLRTSLKEMIGMA